MNNPKSSDVIEVIYVYIIEYCHMDCQQKFFGSQYAGNGRILIFCGCFSHVILSVIRYNEDSL